jgi:hypothetical protein
MERYYEVLHRILQAFRPKLKPNDNALTHFLLRIPLVPDFVFENFLSSYLNDPDTYGVRST